MRELKFRAWDIKRRVMVQDFLSIDDCGDVYGRHTDDSIGTCHIMQFTGVADKNGEEIYEGDILANENYPAIDETLEIFFLNGSFQAFSRFGSGTPLGQLRPRNTYEIIGNIYANNDLVYERE